jgi:hypothetical protein
VSDFQEWAKSLDQAVWSKNDLNYCKQAWDTATIISESVSRLRTKELEKELDSANLVIAKIAKGINDLDNIDQDSHQFVHCWDDIKEFALLTLGRCDS